MNSFDEIFSISSIIEKISEKGRVVVSRATEKTEITEKRVKKKTGVPVSTVSAGKVKGRIKENEGDELAHFEPLNEVRLVGRVSSAPQERELPSGDLVVEFRIVVDRKLSSKRRRAEVRREVDTLDLAAWSPRVRKKALALQVDQWVSVSGAVRRRFWQAPTGLASRWQVEIEDLDRMR